MGEPSDEVDEDPPVLWAAGAVARRLGIAPATLRSWHRRYGLGPPADHPGGHRRYSESDVAVLETMSRLVSQGVAAPAAAAIARERRNEPARTRGEDPAEPIPAAATRRLLQAALRLDTDALCEALTSAFARHGVEAAWNDLCVPALTSLGRRVTSSGDGIDAVLLLSWVIGTSLHGAAPASAATSQPSRVLLACSDGELHVLGLEALHAVLTAQRIPVRMLGASVPTPAVVSAAQRIRPAAVVVWSQVPKTARPAVIRALGDLAVTRIAAGPGWEDARLPAGVERVRTLRQAADAVVRAAPPPVRGPTTGLAEKFRCI
ncbi:MAG: MerR family transcriptional regulator, light-induced transcriptional regulator [Pseudonocardiales bacterium]|nr:MerR family transcriptional regulator, light-induced transcriptional regulator [Pseudonocardiales bacterium]